MNNRFKHITMSVVGIDGEVITMNKQFPDECTWMNISEMFHRFLKSMGYELSMEEVGAEFQETKSETEDAFGETFEDYEYDEDYEEFDRDTWNSEQYSTSAEQMYENARKEYLQKLRQERKL